LTTLDPELTIVPRKMQPTSETIRTVIFFLDDFCLHVNGSPYSIGRQKLTTRSSSECKNTEFECSFSNCSIYIELYRLTEEPV